MTGKKRAGVYKTSAPMIFGAPMINVVCDLIGTGVDDGLRRLVGAKDYE